MNTALRPLKGHQDDAVSFVMDRHGQAGVLLAPGTGKTLVAIRYTYDGEGHSNDLYKLPALIIGRRDDFLTWQTELADEGVPAKDIFLIESGDEELPDPKEASFNYVPWTMVTYDLLRNPRIANWVRKVWFQTCVADEAQQIKRWASARTKAVVKATRHITRRLALTGSPVTNDPLDVFSICLFIDNGKTFGTKEWDFKKKYYIHEGHGWYLRRKAKDEIAEKLKTIAMHVHEDDVLKLPPIRHLIKAVPMYGAQRRHYERVMSEWEYELNKGEINEIDQVIVRLAKLRQISSGFIYDTNGDATWFKSSKLALLEEILADKDLCGTKSKVVIWCAHTAEITKIAELAKSNGWGHVTFSGSNRRQKVQARQNFKCDPTIRLFIGQVDSGVGMNELIVADTSIYFSNSHKVVSRQQSMRRTRRIGSEHHERITYWDLISEGTVDLPILRSVQRSMSLATDILSKLKKGMPIRSILS